MVASKRRGGTVALGLAGFLLNILALLLWLAAGFAWHLTAQSWI
jgi:hypothetical protein